MRDDTSPGARSDTPSKKSTFPTSIQGSALSKVGCDRYLTFVRPSAASRVMKGACS